ncbi:hypothetical protein GCE9029_04138 [Grimontia celer]|uniref:Twin-arginine translocation pathway signal n=1 Tax=Grimontia celer TaxID=1796497 RepID=A0A128FBY4_9GAMM|nr:hypothetical protein [Grimontia celer]CZF84000.1 hypothetical protein GCE9029_04138 [Grimontia celer]
MNNVKPQYSRRAILKMGVMTATAAYAYVAAGISLSGKSWALTVKALDDNTASHLVSIARSIYPHPSLDDVYYAASVESIDAQAANDPVLKKALIDGVANLMKNTGGDWNSLPLAKRTELLQQVASDPFFQAVRGNMVVSLYDNPGVWPAFGYEGSSFEKGGYINRGFDDIQWLPASGKEG